MVTLLLQWLKALYKECYTSSIGMYSFKAQTSHSPLLKACNQSNVSLTSFMHTMTWTLSAWYTTITSHHCGYRVSSFTVTIFLQSNIEASPSRDHYSAGSYLNKILILASYSGDHYEIRCLQNTQSRSQWHQTFWRSNDTRLNWGQCQLNFTFRLKCKSVKHNF